MAASAVDPSTAHLALPFFDEPHRALARELLPWARAQSVDERDDRAACRDWVRRLGEAGWLRYCVPAASGGALDRLDSRALVLLRETLAFHSPLADFAFAMQGLGSGAITLAGTASQHADYLAPVGRGEKIAAFALSEPEAGSDVGAMAMRAEPTADGWRLSGEKTWISNGGIADFYCVFAKTDPTAGSRGITAFVVDANTPGLDTSAHIDVMAPHPLATLRFDGCVVPRGAQLGELNGGFKLAMRTLDIFRASVAGAALGMGRRALSEAVQHAKKRKMFGQTLADFQLTQAKLGEMAALIDAGALLTYRAAWMRDDSERRGEPPAGDLTAAAAMAKMTATENASRVIDMALQMHGGLGVKVGTKVESLYRDIRSLRIYEGATEVQQLIIGKSVLRPMTASAQIDRFVHDRLPKADQLPIFRYDLPELRLPDQLNLVEELLDKAAGKGFADKPMLRSPAQTLTYAEAAVEVNRIAQVLTEDLGLVPGNRVLLRGGNSIPMALAWLAVVKAGMIAVATMPLLRAKELGDILDKAQPVAALCDGKLLDELETARQAHPVLRTIVAFNRPDEPASLEARAASKSGVFKACPTSSDDIALLAFTSGTTGKPKAPVTTHRDVLAMCEAWPRHILKARSDDIVIGSPPLAFTFGLGGLLIFPMWAGASVYFHDGPYTPEAMVQVIRNVGATITYTAPTFYRQMAAFAKQHGVPSLRISVSAGEALPDATRQLWKQATGIEMLDGIGGTEVFHIYISAAGHEVRPGAVGKAVPGFTARIVDDEGREVPRGTVGKLAIIGPVGCRYLDDPRQADYVKNGWNYPGDAFVEDEDGYFFYQSRADDMIVTAGYNVGGPEVEDALLKHPAVAECGVIGKPDEERGMIVKAFCVLKPGHTGDAAMAKVLQDHVKATIAPFKYPREVAFVASLPRTETGKLQRFKLRQFA